MAFIEENQKPTLSESEKKVAEGKEIDALVKARGFDQGNYRFEPNPNVQRKDGSIINGTVTGCFTIDEKNTNFIVFDRNSFPEKIWKRICTIMGFKYHVHTDIDKFTILPSAVDVQISLVTPVQEEGI